MFNAPSELPNGVRTQLDQDAHGRTVYATRIGGLVVYEVPGVETAQSVSKSFPAVYELLNAHAPAQE